MSQPRSQDEVDPALGPEVTRVTGRARRSGVTQSLTLMGLGWAVVLSLVVGVLAGLWLDGRFGTSPILTIVGLLVGLLGAYASVRSLLRQARA